MKAILYRNLILSKSYLYLMLATTLLLPLIVILPVNGFIKMGILGIVVVMIYVVFLVPMYFLFNRINKNHSEYTFLSLPVKQSTVVNAHYLTGLIFILLTQILLGLCTIVAFLIQERGMEISFDLTGTFMSIAGNLLTISLILPFAEYKRLINIPIIFWMIIVGAIVPNSIQFIDYVLKFFSIQSQIFTTHDMSIFLGCSMILFIVSYIISINKARKHAITI
ncbi:ABC-2 transporter permease [Mammaliicoccus sciuri]|uniref:phenol-soluble modulin export ABC transporter permease subunit PmtB n=1 Tax=Mammaliicoccus TaxID=2803850 RepID=UPI00129A080A|nr:ABC-2 transporter permease [Mammaliicoccus sciuri]MBV5105046.1 ABC-2 transporter permease [Mammaliicoccus sciuri]MCD8779306.1 ABC-2 transporter permease [Mammaliicoccus sciuri]MCD8781985.1 ABC-2 transporter permease [Mammaliicoccus sciuri]MEB5791517.1 ABC-2 transporter permease [Mammaliicoccus sciuri]MEB6059267.1 ABC-2 transporter permease [Mammaliicoccus sciuri]